MSGCVDELAGRLPNFVNVRWLGKASWASGADRPNQGRSFQDVAYPSTCRCDNKLSFVSSLPDIQLTHTVPRPNRQWPPHRHPSRDSYCPGCHGLPRPSPRFMPLPAFTPQRNRQPPETTPHEHFPKHTTFPRPVASHSDKQQYNLEDTSRPPRSAAETTTLTHSSLCKG